MKHTFSDFSWFILLAIAAIPAACYAGAIQAASGGLYAEGFSLDTCCAAALGPFTNTNANGFGLGAATLYYGGSAASNLLAIANSGGMADSPPGTSGAGLIYYYEVVPVPGLVTSDSDVPYVILYEEDTSATCNGSSTCGNTYAYAELYFGTKSVTQCTSVPDQLFISQTYCSVNGNFDNPGSFDGTASLGTVYELDALVQAYAYAGGSATAMIDPQIFIDPSFPDAADFTIEVSAFTSTVPEPSSSFALGTGLLAWLGAGLYRRRSFRGEGTH